MNENKEIEKRNTPRGRGIWLGVLSGILVLLFGAALAVFLASELIHRGMRASQWVKEFEVSNQVTNSFGVAIVPRPAEDVRMDPAFQAFQGMGNRGLPTYREIVSTAEVSKSFKERARMWIWWNWDRRFRGATSPPYQSNSWTPEDEKVRGAAAFALLSLDAKQGGGLAPLMEVFAVAAEASRSPVQRQGSIGGFDIGIVMKGVLDLQPERRVEFLAAISKGFQSDDKWSR